MFREYSDTLRNTVHYTEDFFKQRFVISRFHCIGEVVDVTEG